MLSSWVQTGIQFNRTRVLYRTLFLNYILHGFCTLFTGKWVYHLQWNLCSIHVWEEYRLLGTVIRLLESKWWLFKKMALTQLLAVLCDLVVHVVLLSTFHRETIALFTIFFNLFVLYKCEMAYTLIVTLEIKWLPLKNKILIQFWMWFFFTFHRKQEHWKLLLCSIHAWEGFMLLGRVI